MNDNRLDRWLALFGNFAVLAGLVFLAFEIQQNTNAVRASAVQEATNVARNQILLFVQDPDINRIAMTDYASLSPEDRRRRWWLARSYWLGMQGLYRQFRLGAFPNEEWETWQRIICINFVRENPEIWADNAQTLATDFVAMVENCDMDIPGVLP